LKKEFPQISWNTAVEAQCRQLVRLAVDEDLGDAGDLTTRALVPEDAVGGAALIARQDAIVCGLPAVEVALEFYDPRLEWTAEKKDGAHVERGELLGVIEGPVHALLMAERVALNLLGRLSGVATLTARYVERIAGTKAHVYDTRKTTPGWRLLEKYAVGQGGGRNHRPGLYGAVLIKDNHLAFGKTDIGDSAGRYSPGEAVDRVKHFLRTLVPVESRRLVLVEVEVDTLEQLDEVLPHRPDLILLDNMPPEMLREAVRRRDAAAAEVELEASGGISLETIRAVAETGVERISVGALTHSAVNMDVGLDWLS
jgi:nicotinate-nucleotide pyrophosphorylase (carboxylating)